MLHGWREVITLPAVGPVDAGETLERILFRPGGRAGFRGVSFLHVPQGSKTPALMWPYSPHDENCQTSEVSPNGTQNQVPGVRGTAREMTEGEVEGAGTTGWQQTEALRGPPSSWQDSFLKRGYQYAACRAPPFFFLSVHTSYRFLFIVSTFPKIIFEDPEIINSDASIWCIKGAAFNIFPDLVLNWAEAHADTVDSSCRELGLKFILQGNLTRVCFCDTFV